jgi:hypothetical protein
VTTTEQTIAEDREIDAYDPGAVGTGANPGARTASSRRAYERRQRRTQKMSAAKLVGPGKPVRTALNRAPFVVVLIGLLGAGIAAVLYLNTMTDEAGMRASTAKSKAIDLRLTIEALERDVAMLDATPRIADQARAMGLVPAGDSAMLIVDAVGAGSVIGDPTVVPGQAPPVDPAAQAAADAAAQAATAQAAADSAAQAAAAAQPALVDPAAPAPAAVDPAAPAAAAAPPPTDPAPPAAEQTAAAAGAQP